MRWVALITYACTSLFSMVIGLVAFHPQIGFGNPDWMLVVTAAFSHATAVGALFVWACRIRRASQLQWVKGTEVAREVTALYFLIILAAILFANSPTLNRGSEKFLGPLMVFLAATLWSQTAGPGWEHYLKAREEVTGSRTFKFEWRRNGHNNHVGETVVLSCLMLFNAAVPLLHWLLLHSWPVETPLLLGFLACEAWLSVRARTVRAATGALWAKATKTLRQVAAANIVLLILLLWSRNLPSNQSVSYSMIIDPLSGLLILGAGSLIAGPGRTAHMEVAVKLAEKSQDGDT